MATTIKNAQFTSSITDGVTLNGVNYGNTNAKSISGCNEATQRIVTVPVSTGSQGYVSLFGADGGTDEAGNVSFSEFKYARITNLDDTNSIYIQVTDNTHGVGSGGATTAGLQLEIPAGMTFILPSPQFDTGGSAAAGTGMTSSMSAFTTGVLVQAVAITADVDVEIFVVTA